MNIYLLIYRLIPFHKEKFEGKIPSNILYKIYADISFKRVKTGASRVHYLLERTARGIEKRKMEESLEEDEKEGRKEKGARRVVAGRRRKRDEGKRKEREREQFHLCQVFVADNGENTMHRREFQKLRRMRGAF